MDRRKALLIIGAFFYMAVSSSIVRAEDEKFEKAIWMYRHENYEEAADLLKTLRAQNPKSPEIAYYLGLTYKQLQDLVEARPHLEAAATLTPEVKQAIPELVDVLYQCEELKEAKRWIERAEKESIAPAQTAFQKGLVLLKEGDDIDGAIVSFDRAKELDPSLAKNVDYYKGICYMQAKRLEVARQTFQTIAIQDPTAEFASYANEYVDAIKRREDAAKAFRGNIGWALQYDDNVILNPVDTTLATGIGNKGDWRSATDGQMEYNFRPTERLNIKAGYSFYWGKEFDLGFYDTLSNDFSLYPMFTFDKAMIAMPIHYNQIRINDKRYVDIVQFGGLGNIMLDRDNMAQFTFMHSRSYYNWLALLSNDTKDAFGYLWSAGWFYFFTKRHDGFVNLRYAINYDDAKGDNWTYLGNRVSVTAVVPISKKVSWSVVGDYFRQDFKKLNTTYEKARHDDILTASTLVAIEIFEHCQLQLQYTFINDAASIGVFKYTRNMYGAGIKYDF